MTLYKAEVYIELQYENLCYRCIFAGASRCKLSNKKWMSEETNDRPSWCELKEVKVVVEP
jgi:hypothetical protein